MPTPLVSFSPADAASLDASVLVFVLSDPTEAAAADQLAAWDGLTDAIAAHEFTGAQDAFSRVAIAARAGRPTALVGAGDGSADAVRRAVGTAVRSLTGVESIAVVLVGATADHPGAAAEGAALGGYAFAGYRTSKVKTRAAEVVIVTAVDADVQHATVIGDNVALVKDLVAQTADSLGPAELAAAAAAAVADLPITVEVWDEERLSSEGFGGILGVGAGSDRPPRLIRLDYTPADATRHVALVGKGITFDTGGLSLKPAASMVGMKYDMAGAATVLGAVRAAAQLEAPVRVTAWLCVSDNMPSGRATRPGDVLTMHNGLTVEVLNTDAEGRLVLGDGLSAASDEHPDLIIDVATLTGAMVVALGNRHTGVFGDQPAVDEYLSAARDVDELAWQLPLPAYMEDELDSPIADLRNAKIGDPAGGSLFAALFLQRFVGTTSDADDAPRIPWVHLDIAGSGENKGGAYGYTDKGFTAVPLRTLIRLLTADADTHPRQGEEA